VLEFDRVSHWRWLLLCLAVVPALTTFGAPRITEFMAANDPGLTDEDGAFSDWIEIHNPDRAPVSLAGYHLTDNAANLNKWTFPAVTLDTGAYLVVFASGKNRSDPAGRLHTDFQLSAEGEYLALVAPDGVTVVSAFAPAYPPQFGNVSFGLGQPGSAGSVNLTPAWSNPGNYANVYITGPQSSSENGNSDNLDLGTGGANSQAYLWFDFSSRLGQLPAGAVVNSATLVWRGSVSSTLIGSPTVDSMLGIFPVPDARHGIDTVAAAFTGRDMVDYYAAHPPVAAFNALPGQSPIATWNIASLVQQWIDNPAMAQRGQIMILNASRPMYMDWNTDVSGKPVLTLNVATTSDSNAPPAWSFFSTPTPGAPNASGTRAGPIIDVTVKNPPQPVAGPLTITATVRPANDPVATVKLYYRPMFAAETILEMTDDGTGGDATAGDGIWTAIIPGAAFAPGKMTRWRLVAADSKGTETKEPAYREPLDSPQYFGTVAQDADLQTRLPVFHWFTSSPAGANTLTGSRGAVYYQGEFYDNVLFTLHGQSSAEFPKKSYNIDFNRPQRFRWSTNAPRVADIDLLTNWADKSKVRHVLAYEVMREAGVAAHFAYTVRVQQNGIFFSTADFVEDADEIYLERAGLNPDGALYKVYANLLDKDAGNTATSGVEKKTRKFENNNDLQALINGLDLTGPALTKYLYDHIDIPRCVNMLAVNSVIRNIDMHSKNWYIYRDTGRSGEWAILPWDLDLSHGRVWNTQNTYFDNALYTDGFVVTGTSIRLVAYLFADSAIRPMILRRIRTLTDRFLQPPPGPGTPESQLYYERRLNEQSALIGPPAIVPSDARRDFEKWGSWLQGGRTVSYTNTNSAVETMAKAIQRWKSEYLPARRNYIYNTQVVGKGGAIPLPQTVSTTYHYTPLLVTGAPARALVPTNGTLGVTWIGIPSFEPFDTTGWISGATGVGYERGTGYETLIGLNVNTQMQSNNSVYLRLEFNITNPAAFDRLELRMKYDDGFVAFLNGAVLASANSPSSLQWNSAATAQHKANAAAFDIYDVTDKRTSLRAGRNILAIQGLNDSVGSSGMIIAPELHGGTLGPSITSQPVINFGALEVSPASGNQDAEFIQLLNPNPIAVDISDWRLTGGIEHTFAPGTVLAPNGALYVCPNAAAFRTRTVSPKGGEGLFVQGGYHGHLSSHGETLTLIDSSGATNSTTTYPGQPSDAQLYLVVSELMYHPAGDGLAEFIELLNISDSVTLDLTDVRFTQGVEFNFTNSAIRSLAPGARVLIVRDLAAFTALHGAGHSVAGVFANGSALSNGGESIKLEDADNGTIREFTYTDEPPWPAGTDGSGYSLVLIAPHTNPDHALATNWRSSARPGGSPGGTDVVPFPADPLADANGNGVHDLIDYALGNDLGRTSILPACTWQPDVLGGSDTLLVTYPVSLGAERALIEVLFSTDLIAWQEAGPNLEAAAMTQLGDGRALVTWRVKPPLRDEPQVFMRLRVTGH
jgi:hypothetical protein